MISAREADVWGPKAAERGADGYIQKPVDIGGFVNQVTEILDGA